MITVEDITAVIIAGGAATRMGGVDKGLQTYQGKPLVEPILRSLQQQVPRILINANRNSEAYQQYGYPVICDALPASMTKPESKSPGPLAGFYTGLKQSQTEWILTCPCDTPAIANNYADKMISAVNRENSAIAVASDATGMQPLFCLLSKQLLPSLETFLVSGKRKCADWIQKQNYTTVSFSDEDSIFVNINTLEELEQLEKNQ